MKKKPICSKCGHEFVEHKGSKCHHYYGTYEGEELNRECKCPGYKKLKKMWRFLRLMSCPIKLHPPAVMVTVHIDSSTGERIRQCPRCKHRVVESLDGSRRPYREGQDIYLTRD